LKKASYLQRFFGKIHSQMRQKILRMRFMNIGVNATALGMSNTVVAATSDVILGIGILLD
jgi:hypothetical protein